MHEFATKTQSLYFAHKAVEFRNILKDSLKKDIMKHYHELFELFEKSRVKRVFQHYIFTHLLLNNIQINPQQEICSDVLPFLHNIFWDYKALLYSTCIEKIVKLNTSKTHSSVIIISNGNEAYIINTLKEIHKQNKNNHYKIVFVSNNHTNCTPTVLSLVDTFIQMRENNGAYLARNIGSVFALSEILIFLEDDGIPDKHFVKTHEKIHNIENIISVRGTYLTLTNGNMPGHYWLGAKERPAPTISEGNSSFKSKRFYEIGGWGDYIMFGHGGLEICHRMLMQCSTPNQHIYSPKPILYHDWTTHNKNMEQKLLTQYASWQVLKFSYDDFHDIMKKWN